MIKIVLEKEKKKNREIKLYFLTVIFTFLLVALKFLLPPNLIVPVYLPFLFNLVILKVALPLELVVAL